MMKRIRLRSGISMVIVAASCMGLASGCGSKDTGQQVSETPEQVEQKRQQQITEVQNNPNISPAQKQQILGRLQAGGAGGGEAAARNQVAPKVGIGDKK